MKISELAYSPAEMVLNNEKSEEIQKKNKIYYFDEKKTVNYAKILDKFYVDFYRTIKSLETKSLKGEEWLVVLPSIVFIINSIFDRLEILYQAEKLEKIEDDIKIYQPFFPQHVTDLLSDLASNRLLTASLLSILLNMSRQKKLSKQYRFTFPWKLWLIRELVKLRNFITRKDYKPDKSKRFTAAVLDFYNLWSLIQAIKLPKIQVFNIDNELYKIYSLPQKPKMAIREKLKEDILSCFKQIKFNQRFYHLKNLPNANDIIAQIIAYLLPVSLIENFQFTKEKVKKVFNKYNPVVTLTCAAQYDDFGSFWLYIAKKNQVPLFMFQHGSGYNYFKTLKATLFIETGLFPCAFFSWGKQLNINLHSQKVSKIVDFGSPYLNKLPNFGFPNTPVKKILFPVDTVYYQQSIIQGNVQAACFYKKINLQINLIKKLIEEYPKVKILLKNRGKVGFFIYNNLPAKFKKNIEFINTTKRAHEYFEKDMLVFCPTVGGGVFNESIISGTRFILYIDEAEEFIDENFKLIEDKFKKFKIAGNDFSSLYECFKLNLEQKINYQESTIQKVFAKFFTNYSRKNIEWKEELSKYLTNYLPSQRCSPS